jgi:acetate kinase
MKVAVINTGPSSLKFSLIDSDGERLLLDGQADWGSMPASLTVRRPGREADARDLPEAGHGSADRAVLAHLLRQTVGAFAATLGGLDALVFTAGVGEHSPDVRAAACQGLELLGVGLDAAAGRRRGDGLGASGR